MRYIISPQLHDKEKADDMYTVTSGALAREAGTSVPTIALYAKKGWLDYVVASNGVKLFKSGQAAKVRKILAQRMANRTRRHG